VVTAKRSDADSGRTIRLHPTVESLFVEFERLFAAGEANRYYLNWLLISYYTHFVKRTRRD
jgi:hypothetical protein